MYEKPLVELSKDGSPFYILDACVSAARRDGWDPDRIVAFVNLAMIDDFQHLLNTVSDNFNVTGALLNQRTKPKAKRG